MAMPSGTTEGYVLRCLGFANGTPCPHDGYFVRSFDHEAHDGRGSGEFTRYVHLAMKFDTIEDALKFYRRIPKCKPLRDDGNPNRPLTCMHAEVTRA